MSCQIRPAWDELEDVVIKLAGPRWRREARIRGQPAAMPGPYPTPVTPTITDPPPSGPAPVTEIRPAAAAALSAADPPPRAAAPPATPPVSPARRPGTGGETVIEHPRRQDAGAEKPAEPIENSRRRKPLLVAALAALPRAGSLDAALTEVGNRWRSLAAAALRGSRGGYTAASDALRRSERRLAQAALAAERGP